VNRPVNVAWFFIIGHCAALSFREEIIWPVPLVDVERTKTKVLFDKDDILSHQSICKEDTAMRDFFKSFSFRVADDVAVVGAGRAASLDTLRPGEVAKVVELSPSCSGYERKRLMDLGLVPGSVVERDRRAPFGGPIAFRLRGVTLALRPADASLVAVDTRG
jgi:Fe2+ transport system protein FeoA